MRETYFYCRLPAAQAGIYSNKCAQPATLGHFMTASSNLQAALTALKVDTVHLTLYGMKLDTEDLASNFLEILLHARANDADLTLDIGQIASIAVEGEEVPLPLQTTTILDGRFSVFASQQADTTTRRHNGEPYINCVQQYVSLFAYQSQT